MFGARYPIILAPMGGVGTPELAAAVCEAGGLGSVAAAYLTPKQITAQAARVRALTDRPFAVNLFVFTTPPLDRDPAAVLTLLGAYHRELGIDPPAVPATPAGRFEEQAAAVLAAKPAVFSFTFGIPGRDVLDAFRAAGAALVGTATTADEARALADAGVDAVVAQGAEAGATGARSWAGSRTRWRPRPNWCRRRWRRCRSRSSPRAESATAAGRSG